MFRKRTRLTSQVWTVIFLLLFNEALTQTTTTTTTESIAKISAEEPSKLTTRSRTVLRKFIEDSRGKISNDEKHDSIFTNSTNFDDEIERSSTHEKSKQKDLNNEEKIETEPSLKTFDSLDRTTLADPILKSKLSKNNVSDKTSKLVPDEESLPKTPRNKSKSIFLEAFNKEGTRHNNKKSDIATPEFEGSDDYEIEEHDNEHKEPTTQSPSSIKKESLENFDIEKRINDDNDDDEKEDDSLSLVNDTNVNFKQTVKNETNLISENDDSIDIEFGPKNDVEVVQNITRSPIMRIVQAAEEKKGFINTDKSFVDKKVNKHESVKNFTKKLETDNSADSVNHVDLKNENVKIDISSNPLPATKIEISARADIPLFKLDISPSKIDVSSTNPEPSSTKIEIIPSKTEPSKETDITKTNKPLPKQDIFSPKSDDSLLKIDIPSSNLEDPSVVSSTKLELSKVDANFFKENPESLSKITLNSSSIEVSSKKEAPKTKESIENLSELAKTNENVSPAPRARTISFSGVNEFIPENIDSKIITTKSSIIENSVTKRPSFHLDKEVEVKPYPYLKSDIKKTIDESEEANKASGFEKKIEESTEEVSAYENTIGRRGSDKLVITEPSVVIENSIQQFKPTYFKRSGNSTKLNITVSDFGLATTTTSSSGSIQDNASPSHSPSPSTIKTTFETREIFETKTPTKPVIDNEQKIDLTENGITETNSQKANSTKSKDVTDSNKILPKSEDKEKSGKESEIVSEKGSEKGSEKAKDQSTETPKNSNSNSPKNLETSETVESTKINTPSSVEDLKSNLYNTNATENSTEHPITNKIEVENKKITPNATESNLKQAGISNTEATNVFSTIEVNLTKSQEVHVNNVISTSMELPETTTVEYEFVGLKETTLPTDDIYRDSERSTIPGTFTNTNQHRPTDPKSSTVSNKLTESNIFPDSSKSTMSDQSTDTLQSSNSDESTLSVKITSADKSTNSDTSTNTDTSAKSTDSDKSTTEESSTFSYILRDGTTETISESDTQSSEDSTTIEVITERSESTVNKFATSTDKSSEGRSTSEDKSSTLEIEPDETTSSLLTTLIPNEKITTESVAYDRTTNIPDVDTSTNGELSKRNDSTSVDFTDAKLTSEAPIKTTIDQLLTVTETIAMETSTSPPKPRIISVTSESTISKSITESPTATAMPTLPPEEIRVFVRIVFEGTWSDVCPHLESMRGMIANLLTAGSDRIVSPRQVIFYQTECTEGVMALTSMSSSETPLTALLIYIVDDDGNFDDYLTKLLPNLYKVSMPTIDFPLRVRSFQLVQETDSGNAIAVIVVSSVALICLVLLAGLLFIMRKRQTRFNYGERCRPVSLDAYSLDSVSAYNSVRRKGAIRASKRSYGNPTFEDSSAIPSHPLNFAGLSSFCNDVNAISEEFTGIPQITAKIDELPQGAEVKNRYANVIPLPETRVPLQRLNNDLLTEYINASYVRGPKNATKYYIACQAPTESSVTDFWRMIWEQQSKVIIMLTDLVENGVEKCSEYIPPSEVTDCHRLYGDYQVTLKKRETKEKYAISTLYLKNLENNTFREVSHIWYLWPSNGMPDSASLIAVLLEARALQRGGPGPIVVHCSPGTGRTGTLIALDLGIRQYEITRTVDVPRVVYTIRRDRAGAVQTKEQYAFIYKALNLYATKLSGGALESA